MLVAARPARGSAAGVEGSAAGGKGGAVDGKGGAVDGKSSADGLRNDSGAGRARVPAAEVPCRRVPRSADTFPAAGRNI